MASDTRVLAHQVNSSAVGGILTGMFDAHFFSANRDALRAKLGGAVAVLAGNGLLQRKRDTTFPFAQESNVWYVCGVDQPDIVIIVGRQAKDDALIIPERSAVQEAFNGQLQADDLARKSGVQTVLRAKEAYEYINALVSKSKKGYMYSLDASSSYNKHGQFFVNPAQRRTQEKLRRHFPRIEFRELRPLIAELRVIKQPAEVRAIQHAIDYTSEALRSIQIDLETRKLHSEQAIEAYITYQFATQGAQGHAYDPIVASGANATTLHYVTNNSLLAKDAFVVLDVGAEVHGYAADITRTYAFGTVSQRHKELYMAVHEVQAAAIQQLRPGLTFREFETSVRSHLAAKLHELGLAQSTSDTVALERYYPHATTHFLGLDVHDVGDYNKPLQPGMVITCEPGLYILEEKIGIRLEDDILITETGRQNLSASCPKQAYSV